MERDNEREEQFSIGIMVGIGISAVVFIVVALFSRY